MSFKDRLLWNGGVGELVPTEFKELPIPYHKIKKEDVEVLNRMFKEKRKIEDIVDFVNSKTLAIDIEENIIKELEKIRKSLVKRRYNRKYGC